MTDVEILICAIAGLTVTAATIATWLRRRDRQRAESAARMDAFLADCDRRREVERAAYVPRAHASYYVPPGERGKR